MEDLVNAVAVAAGAVLGALARWRVSEVCKYFDVSPWGTAGINCAGSLVLGAIASHQKHAWSEETVTAQAKNLYLMFGTGFCGSFTTFSTYSVDTLSFVEKGLLSHALCLVLITTVSGVCAATIGYKAMYSILK